MVKVPRSHVVARINFSLERVLTVQVERVVSLSLVTPFTVHMFPVQWFNTEEVALYDGPVVRVSMDVLCILMVVVLSISMVST